MLLRRCPLTWRSLAVILFAPLLAASASAAQRPAATVTQASPSDLVSTAGFTLGWRFTANADVLVTALGQYDFDGSGLADDGSVAIYTLDGTLVVSGQVGPGDNAELDDAFRYGRVAPTLLRAGTDYVVASQVPGDQALELGGAGSAATFDASITPVEGRFAFSGSLVFPSMVQPGVPAWLGPSFRFVRVQVGEASALYGDEDGFGVGETAGNITDAFVPHPTPGEAPLTEVPLITSGSVEFPAFAPAGSFEPMAIPPDALIVEASLTLRTGSFDSGPSSLDGPNRIVLDGIELPSPFVTGFSQSPGNLIETRSTPLGPAVVLALEDGEASLAGTRLSEDNGAGSFQVDFLRLDVVYVRGAQTTSTFYGDDDGFGVGETTGNLSDQFTPHPSPGEAALTDVPLITVGSVEFPAFRPTGGFEPFAAQPDLVQARLTLRTGSFDSGPSSLDGAHHLVLDGIEVDASFVNGFSQSPGNLIETRTTILDTALIDALADGNVSLLGTQLSEDNGAGAFQVDFLRLDLVTIPEPRGAAAAALAALALVALGRAAPRIRVRSCSMARE
jgi:hypothetical protein